MTLEVSGQPSAATHRVAIVVSRFNEFVTSKLLGGAVGCLVRHGCNEDDITCVYVPGAFEIPLAAKRLAESGQFDAIICLGCVIRGETPHFDYVAGEAARGIAQVALTTGVPTIFGVITADTVEQALERAAPIEENDRKGTESLARTSKLSAPAPCNKGVEAALSAIEMVNVFKKLPGRRQD